MSWKQALADPDYIRDQVFPALIKAAMQYRDRRAIYLLGYILLDLCVKKPGEVHPLKAIYRPDLVLEEYFGLKLCDEDIRQVKGLVKLLLGSHLPVFQRVLDEIEKKSHCQCREHNERGTKSECIIPAALLWKYLSALSLSNIQDKTFEELVESLRNLLRILEEPESINRGKWWPEESDPLDLYSYLRTLFVYKCLSKMAEQALDISRGKRGIKLISPDILEDVKTEVRRKVRQDVPATMAAMEVFEKLVKVFDNPRGQKKLLEEACQGVENWPLLQRDVFKFILNNVYTQRLCDSINY